MGSFENSRLFPSFGSGKLDEIDLRKIQSRNGMVVCFVGLHINKLNGRDPKRMKAIGILLFTGGGGGGYMFRLVVLLK
jgi:hypothetical protein